MRLARDLWRLAIDLCIYLFDLYVRRTDGRRDYILRFEHGGVEHMTFVRLDPLSYDGNIAIRLGALECEFAVAEIATDLDTSIDVRLRHVRGDIDCLAAKLPAAAGWYQTKLRMEHLYVIEARSV